MVADGFLAKAAFGHEPTRTCFADDAILAAMIRVEAALALAQADLGMIPPSAAAAIAALGDGAAISIDVLSDGAVREGVKEFSSWPTIPQLYVDGEFLGGCDIVTEMYQSGELEQALQKNVAAGA